MTLITLLGSVYRPRWRRLCGVLALAALTVAAGIGLLGVSGWFLSGAALAASLLTFNLFVPSSLVRVLSFLRIGARYGERVVGHDLTLRLLADLRTRVFTTVVRQSPRQLAALRQGDAVSALTADIDALDMVLLTVAIPVCVALLAGLAFSAVWAAFAPWSAFAIGVSTVLIAMAIPWMLVRVAFNQGRRLQLSGARARDAVLDAVQGHADLVSLDAVDVARHRFEREAAEMAAGRLAQARAGASGQGLVQLTAAACLMAVVVGGWDALRDGRMSGPVLAGLVLATLGFFEIAGPVLRGASRIGAAAAAADRVSTLLHTPNDMPDPADPLALPIAGPLVLDDVSFGYEEGAGRRQVVSGVSLRIEAGQRVALFGESGSGKSTLLHLMMRLYDPVAGAVRYAGYDLRAAAPGEVFRRIALLTQDAPIFLGTVRTNLLIARPEATDDELWRALHDAQLGDFVRGLPGGLDTWTGETGWRLSAGQARRLCLARVLLSSAQVVLLDEPTAGLDVDSERAFFEALAAAAGSRTVVVATHAEVPALAFDCHYRLSSGRVEPCSGAVIQAGL